jgi:hypothetical protein
MMASNDEWVVPASLEARRFCVLEAGSEKMGNHQYFGAIWKQMEASGYEAMLHDLLALDLTTFNVRNVPQTVGLGNQRKLSLPVPEAWWRDCLERGYVFKSKLGLEDVFGDWLEVLSTELLFASYTDFADRRRERHPLTGESLGKFMRKMGAKSSRPQRGIVGEHLTDEGDQGGSFRRVAKPVRQPQPPSYALGTLRSARASLLAATGCQFNGKKRNSRRPSAQGGQALLRVQPATLSAETRGILGALRVLREIRVDFAKSLGILELVRFAAISAE